MSFFRKLDTRLFFLVVLPLLPAIFLVLINNLEQREIGARTVKKDAVQTAELIAARQEAIINGVYQLQASLVQLPIYRGTNYALHRVHFSNLLKLYPYYLNYGLLETNGEVCATAVNYPPKANLAEEAFFKRVMKTRSFAVGDYAGKIEKGGASLHIGYPIIGENGDVVRVIFAALDLKQLSQSAMVADLPKEAELMVVDLTGNILVQNAASETAGRASGVGPYRRSWQDVGFKAGSDGKEWLEVVLPVNTDKTPVMRVCVRIPKQVAYSDANRLLGRNLFLLILVILFAALAAHVFAHRFIISPVKAMQEVAKQISTGDLSARTGLKQCSGQLNDLATAFDGMAEALQKRRDELVRAEAKFRVLVEQSLVGIYVIQEDHFIYVNPKLAELMGYTQEEMITGPLLQFIAPDSYEEVRENVKKRLEGKVDSIRYQLGMLRKDGKIILAEVHGVATEYGGQRAIIGSLLDITDRVQAENEVRRLNADLEHRVIERTSQLEAANRELEAFSYSVSHDLRAPLRHINGYVQMLKEDAGTVLNAECQGYLAVISSSTSQMNQLIDDLLAFSRMSRSEFTSQVVDLNKLVNEVQERLKDDAQGRNIVWELETLPAVEGDAAMLKQVWVNLLSNAVKYTRERNPAHIEIGCEVGQGAEKVFFVRDNGVGFDMKYATKLFGVFQRLHKADEFEGTGIGLAIVQRIILRHKGRVWAEAKQNEGATFFFTLASQRTA